MLCNLKAQRIGFMRSRPTAYPDSVGAGENCLYKAAPKPCVLWQQACAGGDWKKQYSKDQKVKARILYVDPTSKKIKLSLQPELLDLTLRRLPAIGQAFEVRRPTVVLIAAIWP